MSNFIFALNATMPVFLVIVLGWVLKQIKLLDDHFISTLNTYVFTVALPLMLFKDIATTPSSQIYDPRFVIFCIVCTTIMFAAVYVFAELFLEDKGEVGAFAQASARGSAAILGIAFVENIYGNSGMTPMMIMAAVPFYNIYSVIILTISAQRHPQSGQAVPDSGQHGKMIKNTLLGIITNPIILGIFAGMPFSALNITLPPIVMKTVGSVGASATPMALLAVGASFEGRKAVKKIKSTIIATVIKLVVLPAIFFPFALMMGFRESALVAILVMLGSPATVSCYIMAKRMGNDEVLTSSIIVTATLFSSVTLTLWLFILRSMGLI